MDRLLTKEEFVKEAQRTFQLGMNYGRYSAHVIGAASNPQNPIHKQANEAIAYARLHAQKKAEGEAQMIADQMNGADAGLAAGMAAAGDVGGSPDAQIQCPSCGQVVTPAPDGTCPVC